ncbi:outer membrane protein assembly factor BamA [Stappia sp. GBMRC 2046]|uniref:Outer membrane protein assembly factor BamA n=1 Tax=Stappia sediminis TaxID=2692190 RepID=A0A7X3LXS4_9HYPH|nr:outer membrane protein assembly factor BamA [Stappia sediminis]MXN67015.1 outer membrane protein assembly factor BamA [Stappia sediminis]
MQRFQTLTRAFLLATVAMGVGAVAPEGVPVIGIKAAQAAVASRIQVEGTTRIEDATVESYITIRPGQPYGPSDVDESLKALFATGLFEDVSISQSGGTLIVRVVENPIVSRISFEGNDKISDESLTAVVRTTERSVLTKAKVQSDVQNILEAYRRSGRYRASVEPKIISRDNNRVDLVFEINEGDKTGIERITFIGNEKYSDSRLRDVIRTRETGLLGFLRTTDTFDPDRLDADQELIRQFYYRHGYADFRIVSAVADLDREENVFYVTFTVEEGDQYTFGDIDVQTSLSAVDPEELRGVVRTDSGDTYDSLDVEKTLEDMTVEVSKQGYAFAQVRPRANRDFENRTISITYFIEEGPRAYVERINVRGNDRTRDYVIRREFDLAEGDAFNRVLIDKAERRLKNLRFFKEVRVTTSRGSAPDRVIINVDVVEQPTGEVSFGIGYSTSDGVLGDITIQEKNFLGRGQFVRAKFGLGESQQTYEFAFTEPFFLGRRISMSLEAYQRSYDANDFRQYDETTTGGSVAFGLPLREDELRLNLYYAIFNRDVELDNTTINNINVSAAIRDGLGTVLTSAPGYSIVYNTLDQNFNPNEGIYAKFDQQIAGAGGDAQYIRTTAEVRAYEEIYSDWGLIGQLRAGGGYITSIGNDLRVQEQFQHSQDWLRGFQTRGIGPRDALTGDALGGRWYAHVNAEGRFPFPWIPKELGLSGAVFADAGALWDVDPSINDCVTTPASCGFVASVPNVPSDTAYSGDTVQSNGFAPRASIGAGIQWISPFGPLRMDFAWAVLKEDEDKTEIFRLSGGTRF